MSLKNEIKEIVAGIILVFGLHLIVLGLGIIVYYISFSIGASGISYYIGLLLLRFVFGIGIVQLIYVIPAIVILAWWRDWAAIKGAIIGTVITALLNGNCWRMVSNN